MTKHIYLANSKYTALVDDEDYEYLSKFKWHTFKGSVHREYEYVYACRKYRENGKEKRVFMHREVLNAPKGLLVDHIDHNGLNNTKENLRLATIGQNNKNRRKNSSKTVTEYKGVFLKKKHSIKKWGSIISVNGNRLDLGYYETEIEAARAYDQAAKLYHKEFAYLNFPESVSTDQSFFIHKDRLTEILIEYFSPHFTIRDVLMEDSINIEIKC